MIETQRLLLREYTMDDFDALYEIMSDPETMKHYPAPFDEARTRRWIEWNLENYAQYGFGLWAVVLKETGEFIGDCGITLQNIDGEKLPEIGYHIHKKYWRQGFAKEAAMAVRDWAFENTDYPSLYSYCKYTNEASFKTAEAIGMHFDKEYADEANKITHEILENYDFVAIQDEMIANWHKGLFGKQVQHSAMGYIKANLRRSSKVHAVSRCFPSTQKCPVCGKNTKHPLSKRDYDCVHCGFHHPSRDIKAAEMILDEAIRNASNDNVSTEHRAKSPVEITLPDDCTDSQKTVRIAVKVPPMKQEAQVL